MRKSKRMTDELQKVDAEKKYDIVDAAKLVKETSGVKFDATVDVAMRMNLDPTQAEQQLRGAFVLPNGSGKVQRILVLAEGEAATQAEAAGADYVGSDDLISRIKNENWFDFDVIIATPQMMPKIGQIGQILGPKGLMPNPKTGTVTPDVQGAIEQIRAGKVTYRIDKFGNLHVTVGKVSFSEGNLVENIQALYREILRVKPATAKGTYIENISISSTMGPGIKIDENTIG